MTETILVDRTDRVGLITLNRPDALNALDLTLIRELITAASELDRDPSIGAITITGSARAFAAGADIKEMQPRSYTSAYFADWLAGWDALAKIRIPTIAAVAGYALGGGCELAMLCDILLAADTARFGQPEVGLGVIPGIGGSSRLTRAVGRAKAMEMCLTGRMIDAAEAERAGFVSRIVPASDLLDEARSVATTIAGMSVHTAMMIKECVNRAFETSLPDRARF